MLYCRFLSFNRIGVSAQLQKSVTHTFVGTNAYMAPERILAQSYSVKSDVWSLGISIMELAIGRFPYPADDSARSDDMINYFVNSFTHAPQSTCAPTG